MTKDHFIEGPSKGDPPASRPHPAGAIAQLRDMGPHTGETPFIIAHLPVERNENSPLEGLAAGSLLLSIVPSSLFYHQIWHLCLKKPRENHKSAKIRKNKPSPSLGEPHGQRDKGVLPQKG